MANANASQQYISYVAESSYGVTPGTPTMLLLRHTGNSLNAAKTALISEERRSDGQVPFVRHGMQKLEGMIVDFELSYLSLKDWIRNVLRYSLTAARFISSIDTSTNTLSWAATDDSVTRTSGSFITDGALVGMRVRVTNPSGSAGQADAVLTITVVTALKLTFAENVITLQTQTTGTCIFECDYATNGVTENSFSMERGFSDVVQYDHFTGGKASQLSLALALDALVTGSISIIAQDQATDAVTADATPDDVDTSKPMSTDAGSLEEGGSASAIVLAANLTLANGRRGLGVLGDANIVEISAGRHMYSGNLTALFPDAALLNKFLDETETSLRFALQDPAGNEMNIYFPSVLYTGAERAPSGDDVVQQNMPWQAFRNTTRGTSVEISMTPDTAAV